MLRSEKPKDQINCIHPNDLKQGNEIVLDHFLSMLPSFIYLLFLDENKNTHK